MKRKIRCFNIKTGIQSVTIETDDIVKLEIDNKTQYTKKGDFKNFYKRGYVILIGGEHRLQVNFSELKELKKELKDRITKTKKYPLIEYKGYKEKTAIDWTYYLDSVHDDKSE